MKKLLIMLAVLLFSTAAVFAQSDDMDWDLRAGVQLGYVPHLGSVEYPADSIFEDATAQDHDMEVGAFIDLTFLRLQASYGFLLGASADPVDPVDNYSVQYIDVSLLGKLPLMWGDITFWPAVGAGYEILTFINDDADDDNDLEEFYDASNDLFVLAGIGMDFEIAERFVLTPSVLFGYNLMPNPTTDEGFDDVTFREFKLNVNIGLGYSF